MGNQQREFVARPFAGLTGETDWVALREVVPAATATARTVGGEPITVTTLLPNLRPAWKKADGGVVVALQTTFSSGDASRDLAQALELALAAEPGAAVEVIDINAPGPRLQDLLDPAEPFTVTVQTSFEYWQELEPDKAEENAEAIKRASEAIEPTSAVPGLASAYWTMLNKRAFLRWSLGIEEEALLDGLARLQARRESAVLPGAKYAGAFRALGLVIPVWELPTGTVAEDLTEPATEFKQRLDQALANQEDLSVLERRARSGLVARSVTLR